MSGYGIHNDVPMTSLLILNLSTCLVSRLSPLVQLCS